MYHHPFGMMIYVEPNSESYRITQCYLRSATEILGPAPDDTNSWCNATQLKLIMKVGPLPNALDPGFMAFQPARPGRRDEADS